VGTVRAPRAVPLGDYRNDHAACRRGPPRTFAWRVSPRSLTLGCACRKNGVAIPATQYRGTKAQRQREDLSLNTPEKTKVVAFQSPFFTAGYSEGLVIHTLESH
jgi:hypothetical protein